MSTLPLERITRSAGCLWTRCRIPRDIDSVSDVGEEAPAEQVGLGSQQIEALWGAVQRLYRTGLYPAVQVCIRHQGRIVLNRAIGHSHGNAPEDPPGTPQQRVTVETPITIFSAAKAITAMLIHKLDEQRVLHIDDRVCDYIPEFGRGGKQWITLRHVLAHRAGIPNLPPQAMDLELLDDPKEVVEILCNLDLRWRPGRWLAYHAVTGGFVLSEVVRRATGRGIREVLKKEILDPLGLRWTNYGVAIKDVPLVAENAVTGLRAFPPLTILLRNALGASFRELVSMSNEPRFLTAVIPSANIVTTAVELSAFFQCLLDGGSWNGTRVFDPRTIRHAVTEQAWWELDLTLGIPIRHGLGLMLGGPTGSLFGPQNPEAFGHIGFTNILCWADPERRISVALLTSGKPIVSPGLLRLVQLLSRISEVFPRAPAPAF